MNLTEGENLMREYTKRFDRVIFFRFKYSGFSRFDIKHDRIAQKSVKTLVTTVIILIFADIAASILLSTTATQGLKLPEVIAIAHFVTFSNLMLINLTVFNRKCGYYIMKSCIDNDVFLGSEETCFMRDMATKNLVVSCVIVAIASIGIILYMYIVFTVSFKAHIIGTIYFAWLFCTYDDYCIFLSIFGFMSMRVKYLNVAIMKLSGMNSDYVPNVFPFNIIHWKKHFDNKIKYHTRAGKQQFTQAFKMLFNLLDLVIDTYRFSLALGVWTVVMGTFVSVQAFIIYLKSSHVDLLRASVVSGWAAGSWLFMLIVGQQIDMFYQQIEQTKLICSYIQLKPNVSTEIHKLTKGILRTLETRNSPRKAYGLFHLDTGLVFRFAASTFVYITVQLQMAFPSIKENVDTHNITYNSACEFIPPHYCPGNVV